MRTGDGGERRLGYDALGRVVYRTDGDDPPHTGIWRGRYDAWGRLYQEQLPTGAVIRREFDQAGNLVRQTSWSADPTGTQGATVLADTRTHLTSFGAVNTVTQVLAADEHGSPTQTLVTRTDYDASGRVSDVWSGPGGTSGVLDTAQARRETSFTYEPEGGRVLARSRGGAYHAPPLAQEAYLYQTQDDANHAPWPDAIETWETVPDQSGLVKTLTTSFVRDAFGRPVETRRSDGRLDLADYDRSGGAIRTATGAGTTSSFTFDGRGLLLKATRPEGRGSTTYAYDLDGRLLQRVVETSEASPWTTSYAYDPTGRLTTTTHADGTSETFTYNPDDTVATWTSRDGVTITYTYDEGNRMIAAVPSLAAGVLLARSLLPLDGGDAWTYDPLSRLLAAQRISGGVADPFVPDPAQLSVAYAGYDLAGRPAAEQVGGSAPLGWSYDAWSRATELRLPGDDPQGARLGFERSYTTLDQLASASGLGDATLGGSWAWGGGDRLYALTTRGALGAVTRFGYVSGTGPQIPGAQDPNAAWRLGTITFGNGGSTQPTQAPETTWGAFGFGWRTTTAGGDLSDGLKLGRAVLPAPSALSPQPGILTGLGWSWQPDAGERLATAVAGSGSLDGGTDCTQTALGCWQHGYGKGDELQAIIPSTGTIPALSTGIEGRITSRDGAPFTYDFSGRRIEDDRFAYTWDWRGRLAIVDVKPDASNAHSGEQLRYTYDALGRLLERRQLGPLPQGSSDDIQRPFISDELFTWEGSRLAQEQGRNADGAVIWRKTTLPGPGLDDAAEITLETFDPQTPNAPPTATRTFDLLRDEQGSVIGLVEEPPSGSTPPPAGSAPPLLARWLYTPYGEAHAETGPELRRAVFEPTTTSTTEPDGTTVTQSIQDPTQAAAGALRLVLSIPAADASLAQGVTIERQDQGSWVTLPESEIAVGRDPSSGPGQPTPEQLLVLAVHGWSAGAHYRITLTTSLTDTTGRHLAQAITLEWSVPASTTAQPNPVIIYAQDFPSAYDSGEAASQTLGGAIPGGQTSLFQGLWTDPITGIAYARNRWYDARNAAWLSEDSLGDQDSPNLYAFVALQPWMATDPMGSLTVAGPQARRRARHVVAARAGVTRELQRSKSAARDLGFLLQPGVFECNLTDPTYAREVLGSAVAVPWHLLKSALSWVSAKSEEAGLDLLPMPAALSVITEDTAVVVVSEATPALEETTAVEAAGLAEDVVGLPEQLSAPEEVLEASSVEAVPTAQVRQSVEMRPYGGPGGGHHPLAKKAFEGAPGYDLNEVLAISNETMAKLKLEHATITGAQASAYRSFAKTGQELTWETIETIETKALMKGGLGADEAAATVRKAIEELKNRGVTGPTKIPWGG